MSTAETAPGSHRSQRLTKVLLWLGALVLAVGALIFVIAITRNDDSSAPAVAPTSVPNVNQANRAKPVKLQPDVRKVAGEFILTAVARKHLDRAWKLVTPNLKNGITYKDWLKGDIPVIPYPVASLDEARFKVDEAFANDLLIEVALIPGKGAEKQVEAGVFLMGLKRVGTGGNQRWLVDYWMTRYTPRIRIPA